MDSDVPRVKKSRLMRFVWVTKGLFVKECRPNRCGHSLSWYVLKALIQRAACSRLRPALTAPSLELRSNPLPRGFKSVFSSVRVHWGHSKRLPAFFLSNVSFFRSLRLPHSLSESLDNPFRWVAAGLKGGVRQHRTSYICQTAFRIVSVKDLVVVPSLVPWEDTGLFPKLSSLIGTSEKTFNAFPFGAPSRGFAFLLSGIGRGGNFFNWRA